MSATDTIIASLTAAFPMHPWQARPLILHAGQPSGQDCIRIEAADLLEVMTFLRDHPATAFQQLIDLTCVDYLNFPQAVDRYGVTYSLLSLTHGHRIWLKCFLNDPSPTIPSVTGVWAAANWMEREVFDMFGIVFEGHPDLRRILTWDGFEAHPLRKDYPLRGRGERENYEVVTRESA